MKPITGLKKNFLKFFNNFQNKKLFIFFSFKNRNFKNFLIYIKITSASFFRLNGLPAMIVIRK